MKIVVMGTGFVGLTHAAVCSEYGHEVYGYDVDAERIAAYQSGERKAIDRYVNEPGLVDILEETLGRHLFFTTDLDKALDNVDAVYLCLPTPPNRDGSSDLSIYKRASHTLGEKLAQRNNTKRVVIVNKSTVPVGTARMLEDLLKERGVTNFGVASNPEFLPEGNAVEASRKPDRVVVGADTEADFEILRRIYPQFQDHVRIRYIETTPETAEAIKYVANTLLLTYISFWNGVGARLGETFPNIRMEDLKLGVTADARISTWGSYVSNGAGGSCFGKDVQSLIYQLSRAGRAADLLQSVYRINEYQKTYLIDRAVHEADFNFNHKTCRAAGPRLQEAHQRHARLVRAQGGGGAAGARGQGDSRLRPAGERGGEALVRPGAEPPLRAHHVPRHGARGAGRQRCLLHLDRLGRVPWPLARHREHRAAALPDHRRAAHDPGLRGAGCQGVRVPRRGQHPPGAEPAPPGRDSGLRGRSKLFPQVSVKLATKKRPTFTVGRFFFVRRLMHYEQKPLSQDWERGWGEGRAGRRYRATPNRVPSLRPNTSGWYCS